MAISQSIGIGLEASSTSKGPQSKTTEPKDSTKVTYCSIQLGWILARDVTKAKLSPHDTLV